MEDNIQCVTMSEDGIDTVYISLPDHPGHGVAGCVKEMIRLDQMFKDHTLPMVNLDFDKDKNLIGIEVII